MMHRSTAVAALFALLLISACRQETPIERGLREVRSRKVEQVAKARLQAKILAGIDDEQAVRVNTKMGLGLALRGSPLELRVGEPLHVHLAWENLRAPTAISSTTCQGFSLAAEELATEVSTAVSLRFRCPQEDALRDNDVPLPKGQLRTVEISTGDTKLSFDHPGDYIVLASWQSFQVTDGMFLRGSEYTSVVSNEILITVR